MSRYDLYEIAKLCVYAAVIVTCLRIIRGYPLPDKIFTNPFVDYDPPRRLLTYDIVTRVDTSPKIDSNEETTELEATPLGDQSDDEEDCDVAVPDTPHINTVKTRVFSYMERHSLTQKKNIKWRKRQG
ncbi:hypothetical protein ILUMI_19994 [Ignelater luminosus]|uniref:Uncharacterized protein n=1 Tax=Ignelater luminosus TaxID=2038154 RepID=A0A8K0CF43_IGNLU|nr:hypothetical protein ILUMI_19994 [Ignelater luminosus]